MPPKPYEGEIVHTPYEGPTVSTDDLTTDPVGWALTRAKRTAAGMAGQFTDVQQLGNEGVKWLMRHTVDPKFGTRHGSPVNVMPGSEDINQAVDKATGFRDVQSPASWGVAGRALDAGVEGVLSGGRSIVRNAVPSLLAGAGSEVAGSAVDDLTGKQSGWGVPARLLAGLLGYHAGNLAQRGVGGPAPGVTEPVPGAAERQARFQEFGVSPTRADVSQDRGQRYVEQTLAQTPGGGGQGTMQAKLAAQDEARTSAAQTLRSGGNTPLTPEQAGLAMKGGYETAVNKSKANYDGLYEQAKDPQTLTAMKIPLTVNSGYVRQLAQNVRSVLKGDEVGRAVTGGSAERLTPNAQAALRQVEEWSSAKGPNGVNRELSWTDIEDMRKDLRLYSKAAVGNDTDQRAMAKILEGFDQHFGVVNPLLKPAREAYMQHQLMYEPGQPGQDKGTKAALTALQGSEGGASVVNTIFGGGMSRGEQLNTIDHLKNTVFAQHPGGLDAMKQMALRRLVTDKNGFGLTAEKAKTTLSAALDGDREGPAYAHLLDSDELDRLRRFRDMNADLANTREKINAPLSGLITRLVLSKMGAGLVGAAAGHMSGIPFAEVGGYGVGNAAQAAHQRLQAQHAVNPPANYTPMQTGRIMRGPTGEGGTRVGAAMTPSPGGLLNATGQAPQGPSLLDRFWQGIGIQ